MRQSLAASRHPFLDVAFSDGTIFQAPDEVRASSRWIDSHPFVRYEAGRVFVGVLPDEVQYEVIGSDVPGVLYLKKIKSCTCDEGREKVCHDLRVEPHYSGCPRWGTPLTPSAV